jgi:hypothetical protein
MTNSPWGIPSVSAQGSDSDGQQTLRTPETTQAAVPVSKAFPIFTVLAGLFFIACLMSPMLLITLPVMLTLGMAAVAMFRREAPRWLSPLIAVSTVLILFAASSHVSSIGDNLRGDNPEALAAASIAEWNWSVDPDFAGKGTIKWDVSVRNNSDKPLSTVKVELTTYDKNGSIISSDTTYLSSIAPGAKRNSSGYADYFGNEERADVRVLEARLESN